MSALLQSMHSGDSTGSAGAGTGAAPSPRAAKREARSLLRDVQRETFYCEALTVVVLGASGDLAKKKTLPALFDLYSRGYIPAHVHIVGFARRPKTDEEFRAHLRPFLEGKWAPATTQEEETLLEVSESTHSAVGGGDEEKAGADGDDDGDEEDESDVDEDALAAQEAAAIDAFLARCTYRDGQYNDVQAFSRLSAYLFELEGDQGCEGAGNRLFYFAVPPNVYLDAAASIRAGALGNGWNRLIVEKPFGRDYDSARALTDNLSAIFDEEHVYRVDHYNAKELVQNLIMMRFSNVMFEAVWNRNYIQCIGFTFKENFGTEGRGGYFDNFGIIRDICQNHLTQVLSFVAMEPPVKAAGPDVGTYVRDAKVNVLRAIEPIRPEDIVLGQYTADKAGKHPGYLDDETVPPGSRTPTFATMIMYINNPRWSGVPIIMKAGKALNERKAEVRIQFKDAAGVDFLFDGRHVPRNELVMRLQPDEAVYMKMNVKKPGLRTTPQQSELALNYSTRFPGVYNPDAYTRLILDAFRGKQAAFVRSDELMEAWRIFTPVLQYIERTELEPIPYPYGSRGPVESDIMIREKGGYVREAGYQWLGGNSSNSSPRHGNRKKTKST